MRQKNKVIDEIEEETHAQKKTLGNVDDAQDKSQDEDDIAPE